MKAPKAVRNWYKKIGSKGGSQCTEAQRAARAANGAKGGRPKKVLARRQG